MQFAFCIALLALLPNTAPVPKQAAPQQLTTPGAMAECTFTPQEVDRIVSALAREGTDESIEARLDEHACEHGWSLSAWGADFVDSEHALPCSAAVLDRMLTLRGSAGSFASVEVAEPFALSLQRAGRLDRALEWMESLPANSPPNQENWNFDWYGRIRKTELAWTGALLCERDGKFQRALDSLERWTPTPDCSFGMELEDQIMCSIRARLLCKLERFDEARVISGKLIEDADAQWMCLWIGCEIASKRCADSTQALGRLRDATRADTDTFEACRTGKRLWDLRHTSRAEQLKNLGELARLDSSLALSLIIGVEDPIVAEYLQAFDVVDGQLRDKALAEVLAATGNPRLRPAIERAEQARCVNVEYSRDVFEKAQRRWLALSHKRRAPVSDSQPADLFH